MVYTNKDKTRILVNCNCGCADGVEIILDKEDEDDFCSLQVVTSKWYSEQDTAWRRIAKRLKRIWWMARGKDYYHCDVIMKKNEFDEFVEAINNLRGT